MSSPTQLTQATSAAAKCISRVHEIASIPDAIQCPASPRLSALSLSRARASIATRKAGRRGGGLTARWGYGWRHADSARGVGMRIAASKRAAVRRSSIGLGVGMGAGVGPAAAILTGRTYRAVAIGVTTSFRPF